MVIMNEIVEVKKNRIAYLDIIKAISIFLVVFCHTPLLNNNSIIDNIAMIICWGAVPCFFMATGAIYLNKEWNFKKYIKKIFFLYAIICIWRIIYLIFYQSIGTINIFQLSKKSVFSYIFLFTNVKRYNRWALLVHVCIFIYIYNLSNNK